MPSWIYDDWPPPEVTKLRKAWRDHYVAKGCNSTKAMWLAQKKTHTWPEWRTRMKLGELLAIAREVRGWSQRDLESKTGISNALICQIETGKIKDPGFSTVVRLVKALGVNIERAADTVASIDALKGILRATVVGKVTGDVREGDQVPGMPHAICHACGLGYKCLDEDCPNEKPDPTWRTNAFQATGG